MVPAFKSIFLLSATIFLGLPGVSYSEILALMIVQSKTPETLKAFKLTGSRDPKEGLYVMDVDPGSKTFANILMTIPLPNDFLANGVFFNPAKEKAYVTSRGKSELFVFRLGQFPYRLRKVVLPNCKTGQNMVFPKDNTSWYLTCRMSAKIIVGDRRTDAVKKIFEIPDSYPHGIATLPEANQLLVSSSVSGDMNDLDDFVIIIDEENGREIFRQRVSVSGTRTKSAPAALLRVPKSNPTIIYLTSIYDSALRAVMWNQTDPRLKIKKVFDFKSVKASFPTQMKLTQKSGRLYVTTAKPGHLHVFDVLKDPLNPRLIKTIPLEEGAREMAVSKNRQYLFVQNSYLNLTGMSDGSILVIDLKALEKIKLLDALKIQGLNPNSITLLPN